MALTPEVARETITGAVTQLEFADESAMRSALTAACDYATQSINASERQSGAEWLSNRMVGATEVINVIARSLGTDK